MKKFTWIFLPILSGILLFLAGPPLPLWWFNAFALLPLLISIHDASPRRGLYCGLITAFTTTFLGEFWVINSMTIFGGVPYILAFIATCIMSVFGALNLAIFAWLIKIVNKQIKLPAILSIPALYLSTEWVIPKLFPWYIGSWTHGWRAGRQIADITGIHGPNLILIFCNTTILLWVLWKWKKRRLPVIETVLTLSLIISAQIYGSWRIGDINTKLSSARKLTVAVAQTNIGSLQKERAQRGYQEALSFSHKRNEELVLQASESKPDIIVLPETAVHGTFTQSKILQYRMFSLSRDANAAIFFGGYHSETTGEEVYDFNSAFLITPNGRLAGHYNKIKLLVFGEYLPFPNAPIWPKSVKETVGQFARGREIKLFDYKGEKIAPLICFEGILPNLVSQFVSNGATLFTNISNDSWFGDSFAPHQHITLDTWRTIEHRKPLVRSTNTGISGFINVLGDISDTIGVDEAGVRTKTVQIIDEETFYFRHGNWLIMIFMILTVIILLLTSVRIIFRRSKET